MGNWWWARAKIVGGVAALVGSFALSAITWVGIGGITGYGPMRFFMPVVVDAYVVCAIAIGMSTASAQVAKSAYRHALSAAVIGTIAQAVYHCASVWSGKDHHHVAWAAVLAFVGGSLPPSFAFLGVHLLGKDHRDHAGLSEASSTSPETSGGYTQPTTLPTPGAATSVTPTLPTTQRTSQMFGSPPHQAPALTPPAREAPTANPVTATPAPTTQSPRHPAPQSTDASTARSPNGRTGRGSTAASSNGSGTPERREPRERPTRAGRTIPEDKQERIYRMLRSNVATHEQIAEDCEVHPRTVANYSRKMRDRQMAAARNGNERMVRR